MAATPSDPFMAAAAGHVPLSSNAGSASTWFPVEPPRPDRDYSTLKWLSLLGGLGFNDFYLRSPLTGLLKLIIMGVLTAISLPLGGAAIVLTSLWDFLHVSTEKERVVNYGISAPFDLWHGVGQGMVTDKTTNYAQSKNFTIWQLTSVLDFVGLQSLYEMNIALFLRKALDFTFFTLCVRGILRGSSDSAVIWGIIFAVIFGMFVFIPYSMTIRNALNPTKMFKEGFTIDKKMDQFLNFFNLWTGIISEDTRTGVMDDFGYSSTPASVYKAKFDIKHKTEEHPAVTGRSLGSGSTWLLSMLIGNAAGAPLTLLFQLLSLPIKLALVLSGVIGAQTFTEFVAGQYGAGGALGFIGGLLPGASLLRSGAVTAGLGAIGAARQAASGISGAAGVAASAIDTRLTATGQVAAQGVAAAGRGLTAAGRGAAGAAVTGADIARRGAVAAAGGIGAAAAAVPPALAAAGRIFTRRPPTGVTGAAAAVAPAARVLDAAAAVAPAARVLDAAAEARRAARAARTAAPTATNYGGVDGLPQSNMSWLQGGGAREEPDAPLSTEAIALGATVAALIVGGAIKLAVDSLVTQ
jgi:hypothetical protein